MTLPANGAPVPMTVIGGFLGAGKTTLLNRVLTENTGVRYAVMVNDFGDLAIDESLVKEHDGDTLSFANGCVCCTLGDNFIKSLMQLMARSPRPEQILIEASGVADPRAIADIAVLHPALRRDLIVVLADAGTLRERADDPRLSDTVLRQIKSADLLVLNKCDLVANDVQQALADWLTARATAPLHKTSYAGLPLSVLQGAPHHVPEPFGHGHGLGHGHNHPDVFKAETIAMTGRWDLDRLQTILCDLPPSVLRVKGYVRTEGTCLVQSNGRYCDITPLAAADITHNLVVIGTHDMPALAELETLIYSARSSAK